MMINRKSPIDLAMRLLSFVSAVCIVFFSSQALAADGNAPNERERLNAERGNVEAQVNIAITYFNNKNYAESVKWFTKASESGNATAQYNLGNMYSDGVGGLTKDLTEAVKWYSKAAEQGYGFAQNNLGIAYENGQGVKQDYAEAIKWFTKAADQNVAVAQNSLGVMYAKGEAVPKDEAKAAQWYQKAAENNDPKGQFNLGSMYANGQGVKKDVVQAYLWLSLSAAQNKPYAIKRLADIQEIMTQEQIAEGKALVGKWKPKDGKK
jgi:TPR repeat protein